MAAVVLEWRQNGFARKRVVKCIGRPVMPLRELDVWIATLKL